MSNFIKILSAKKKEGRAAALKAILGLSQEIVDFQDKISSSGTEYADQEYQDLVIELEDMLVSTNKKLLDLAAVRMKPDRSEIFIDEDNSEEDEEDEEDEEIGESDVDLGTSSFLISKGDLTSPREPKRPFSIK